VAYLQSLATRSPNPIRKVAVVGLSSWQRLWDRLVQHIDWPKEVAFFSDWEAAKAWLIGER